MYLLNLVQQISTFAVNYQGRPHRESLSENRGMWWGIVGVSAIAFSCSTEFIPELNEGMKLVKFSDDFKWTITALMVGDFVACWSIEKVLKLLFSDLRPRDIAVRRRDQNEREEERRAVEKAAKLEAEEKVKRERAAELERKVEERARKIQAWAAGRQQQAAGNR